MVIIEFYFAYTHIATLLSQPYSSGKKNYSGFLFGTICDGLAYALLYHYIDPLIIYLLGLWAHTSYVFLLIFFHDIYFKLHRYSSGYVFRDNQSLPLKWLCLPLDTLFHTYAYINLLNLYFGYYATILVYLIGLGMYLGLELNSKL